LKLQLKEAQKGEKPKKQMIAEETQDQGEQPDITQGWSEWSHRHFAPAGSITFSLHFITFHYISL
jgi:hypothetical protein